MNTELQKISFKWTQYNMLIVCVDYATSTENQPITDLIPEFKTGITGVKSKINSIRLLIAAQQENTTGSAEQKLIFKRNLAKVMFTVSDPVAGYAAKIGDNELYNSIAKSITSYMRMKPQKLISQADLIIATVTPLLPNLIGTSVDQASLDAIVDARDLFAPYASKPRSKTVIKRQKLELMVSLLKDAMNITRTQLDRFASGFLAINQSSYYTGWVRSRKLTPYGTQHTRASVEVVLGDTPVPNATVSIDFTVLKGTTDNIGHVTISRVPYGDQSLTVTAPGFPNPVHVGPFKFKKGQATHITVNMAEFNVPAPTPSPENVNS